MSCSVHILCPCAVWHVVVVLRCTQLSALVVCRLKPLHMCSTHGAQPRALAYHSVLHPVSACLSLSLMPSPRARYYDDGSGLCQPCLSPCNTCSSLTACTSCVGSRLLYAGTCVQTCPDGLYGDTATRLCMQCAPSCGTCVTGSPEACTSCSAALDRQLVGSAPARCGCAPW